MGGKVKHKAVVKIFKPVETSLKADGPNTDGHGEGGGSLPYMLVEHRRKAHLDLKGEENVVWS